MFLGGAPLRILARGTGRAAYTRAVRRTQYHRCVESPALDELRKRDRGLETGRCQFLCRARDVQNLLETRLWARFTQGCVGIASRLDRRVLPTRSLTLR